MPGGYLPRLFSCFPHIGESPIRTVPFCLVTGYSVISSYFFLSFLFSFLLPLCLLYSQKCRASDTRPTTGVLVDSGTRPQSGILRVFTSRPFSWIIDCIWIIVVRGIGPQPGAEGCGIAMNGFNHYLCREWDFPDFPPIRPHIGEMDPSEQSRALGHKGFYSFYLFLSLLPSIFPSSSSSFTISEVSDGPHSRDTRGAR